MLKLDFIIILNIVLFFILIWFEYNKQSKNIEKYMNFNGIPIKYIENDVFRKKTKYHDKLEVSDILFPKNLGRCLTLDNEVQLCSKSEHIYHEMMVHFPIAYLPKVQYVLIIGGGDMMNIRELIKYESIIRIDFCEIDKDVVDSTIKYFNVEDYTKHPKVNFKLGDALHSLKELDSSIYDLIIVDLTENENENSEKLVTTKFIKKIKKKLNKNGILIINGEHLWKVEPIFKFTCKINIPLDYFETNYGLILASDTYNFLKYHPLQFIDTPPKLKYYDRDNHMKYFSWFNFQHQAASTRT